MYSLLVQNLLHGIEKQSAISLSSAEAEYRVAVEASKEAMWLCQILSKFGLHQQHPTTLWCDNQSAIQLCKDPVQHQRMKHIDLHIHFIRKPIHDRVLEVQYCPINDQVAYHRSEVYQTSIHAWSSGKLSVRGDRL